MPAYWICPKGHRWQPATSASSSTCPRCGAAGRPIPDSRTISSSRSKSGDSADSKTLPPSRAPSDSATFVHKEGDNPSKPPSSQDQSATSPLNSPNPSDTTGPISSKSSRIQSGITSRKVHVPGYEILEELGRGGMGVVYKARHLKLDRIVALKMILAGAHASPSELRRFRDEAEAVARLHHNNIIQVYSVGEKDGLPYFALEFADKGSLAQHLSDRGLPPRQSARLVAALARAVMHAHGHGIIHRDLKPANVLLVGADAADNPDRLPFGVPKIADFGLAKKIDSHTGQTRSGSIVGTPSYMSPEQASGKVREIGKPADIYALGAILYECLTGRAPFVGDNPLDIVLRVISEQPVPPRQIRSYLPQNLETICLKCLAKDPKERYTSARALAEDLELFLRNQPIRAQRVGSAGRVLQFIIRRPLMIALSAVLLIALTVSGILWGADAWRIVNNQGVVQFTSFRKDIRGTVIFKRDGVEEARMDLGKDTQVTLPVGDYTAELLDDPDQTEGLDLDDASFSLVRNSRHTLKVVPDEGELLAGLSGHTGPIRALAVNAEGTRAVSGAGLPGKDSSLRLWDLTNRVQLARFAGHPGGVLSVDFSADGNKILSGGVDRLVRLWDVGTGKPLRSLSGHTDQVTAVAFSPDAKMAVSGSRDRTVRVWRLDAGKDLVLEGHTGSVTAVCFVKIREGSDQEGAKESLKVLSAARDGSVRLWDISTGQTVRMFGGQKGAVWDLAVSPEGDWFLTACEDRRIRRWDLTTGRLLGRFDGHRAGVRAVTVSADGREAVSCGLDRSMRVWDVATGRVLWVSPLLPDSFLRVAYRNGTGWQRQVVAAGGVRSETLSGSNFRLNLYKIPRPVPRSSTPPETDIVDELLALKGHTGEVRGLAMTPDGKRAWSAGTDQTLREWDLSTGKELRSIRSTPQTPYHDRLGQVNYLAISADGKYLLSGSQQNTLLLWDIAKGEMIRSFRGTSGQVASVAFSPKGDRIVSAGGWDSTIRVWETSSGKELGRFFGHASAVEHATFSPDGKHIASCSHDRTVRMWDAETGKVVRQFIGHTNQVWASAFTPDGKRLVSCSHDRTVRIWDVKTGKELHRLTGHNAEVVAVAVSRDGKRIVSGSWDGTVRVWDTETGKPMGILTGHSGRVYAVVVSADGGKALSTGSDGTVRVWQLPRPGQRPKPDSSPAPVGILVLKTEDANAWIELRQNNRPLTIVAPGVHGPVELPPGVYQITMPSGRSSGLRPSTPTVTIKADAKEVVEFTRDPTAIGYMQSIDTRPLGGMARILLHPDGKRVLVLGTRGQLNLYEIGSDQPIQQIGVAEKDLRPGTGLALSPDGKQVLLGSPTGSLVLYNLESGKEIKSYPSFMASGGTLRPLSPGTAVHLALHPDGERAVALGPDNTLVCWSLKTGKELVRYTGHEQNVRGLALSPDGTQLASFAEDGIRVWETNTAKPIAQLKPPFQRGRSVPGPLGLARDLAWTKDGRRLVLAVSDGTVSAWTPAGGTKPRLLGRHEGEATAVCCAEEDLVLSTGTDHMLRIWERKGARERFRLTGVSVSMSQWRQWYGSNQLAITRDLRFALVGSGSGIALFQLPIFRPSDGLTPADSLGQVIVESDVAGCNLYMEQSALAPGGRSSYGSQLGLGPNVRNVRPGAYRLRLQGTGTEDLEVSPQQVTVRGSEQITARIRWRRPPDLAIGGNEAALAALEPLRKRAMNPAEDRAKLRDDLLAFIGKHAGKSAALDAAGLLRRLPGPGDAFKPEDIPAGEKAAAGEGDPAKAPCGLVAVLGDSSFPSSGPIVALARSPDNKWLAVSCQDGEIRLYDWPGGRLQRVLWPGQPNTFFMVPLAFSSNGKLLAAVTPDRVIRLWDCGTGKLMRTLEGNASQVYTLAFHPDGKRLYSGASDGKLHGWALDRESPAEDLGSTLGDSVYSVAVSPDGRWLAVSTRGRIIIREAKTLRPRSEIKIPTMARLVFAPDSRTLAILSPSLVAVRLWDVQESKELHRISVKGAGYAVAFDSTGDRLAVGSTTGVSVFKVKTAERVANLTLPSPMPISGVDFFPARDDKEGKRQVVLSTDRSGAIRIWDLDTGKELISGGGHRGGVRGLAFSPDGKTLATIGVDGTLRLWSMQTGKELSVIKERMQTALQAVEFSPDGKILAVFDSYNGNIRLYDAASGKTITQMHAYGSPPFQLAFSSDGKTLVMCGGNNLRSYDLSVQPPRGLSSPYLNSSITSLALSPDGSQILGRSGGNVLFQPIQRTTQNRLQRRMHVASGDGHMALRGDGKFLATSGPDGSIRLWKLGTEAMPQTFLGRVQYLVDQMARRVGLTGDGRTLLSSDDSGASRLLFTPDGERLLAVAPSGRLRQWSMKDGAVTDLGKIPAAASPPSRRPGPFQFPSQGPAVAPAAISPDGKYLAVAGQGVVYVLKTP